MHRTNKAFTLIELLVVIAIIAILAAILFPVFAQAKAAAKTTQSISNMKQIGTAIQMYLNDFDDVYAPRRVAQASPTGQPGELSWKQLTFPYIKSIQLFNDTVNPAAKYPDDTSDDALRASWGQVVVGPKLGRGYAFFDAPWLYAKNWGATTLSPGQVENPAGTLTIAEHKRMWVDLGPWLGWDKNDSTAPVSGSWPWGGAKWEDKAMVVIFHDTHARRRAHTQICGRDDQPNDWGYTRNQLGNYGGLGEVQWVDTYCSQMPIEVK
ncbi:MAG: prepilin-type N-terminal cleavage/methylation domain-containing protein [Fimbriimonas sp.]